MGKTSDIAQWGNSVPVTALTLGTYGMIRGGALGVLERHYPRARQIGGYDLLFPLLKSDSNFHTDLRVKCRAVDRLDDDAQPLKAEFNPQTATILGLLPFFEDLVGFVPTNMDSLSSRRKAVVTGFRATGGLSRPYFQSIAEGFGYNYGEAAAQPRIWFEEGQAFAPFRLGYSKLGETLWEPADTDLFKPFTLGVSKLGDKFFSSSATTDGHTKMVIIHGTDIESDLNLRKKFDSLSNQGVKFRYRSE